MAPVFIVGPSRSGTTPLSRILDAHSAIAILPETSIFGLLGLYGCTKSFQNRWQYTVFMNEVWEGLRDDKDVASNVVANQAKIRPSPHDL